MTRAVSKSHRGPIPSAEELEHLEQVLEGSANRCFEMAEREQSHRHLMESEIVSREFKLRGRGQIFALVALALLLTVVGIMAFLGDSVSAAALGSATIIGVVAIFITGRSYDAKESAALQEPSTKSEPDSRKQLGRSDRKQGKPNKR
nr:DUF2335 domain-containing protein [Sphingomonas yantingensis]